MLIEALHRPVPNPDEVLYHKDVGFPEDIHLPRGFGPIVDLNYGSHSRMESMKDKYGEIHLPHRIDIRKGQTIEIGVTGKEVTKLVLRFSYDQTRDIIIVILTRTGLVKTVWFNLKNDQHTSLDPSKYANPNTQPAADATVDNQLQKA